MDNEGHLVSMKSNSRTKFHLSNESIEHLFNFPNLRNLKIWSSTSINQSVTNLSLLSNLRKLEITFENEFNDTELFKDLGLFSNLISLDLFINHGFEKYQFDSFPSSTIYFVFLLGLIILPPSFSNLSNLVYLCLIDITFQGFKKNSLFIFSIIFICEYRRGISFLFPKYDKINKYIFG